jgi:hypothetical protein
MPVNKQNDSNFFSNLNNTLNNYNTPAEQAAAATAQNPYQSALIATASAQSEAKRNLDASQAAVAAYPDNSTYQAQLQLNQERYVATQQAYTTAQTNFNSANEPIAKLNATGIDTGTNGDTRTTGQTQSTPASPLNITNDDNGGAWAPTSSGTGAGKANESAKSVGPDDTPPTPTGTVQQAINTAFSTQLIATQPNVLDQYASYTYSIGWWLLTPEQYYGLSTAGPDPNTGAWTLLMQSGGAPVKGRSQAFPYDYYLDDLEIESTLAGKGTGMSTNGMSIHFKVVEPNGLTLLQRLFEAVNGLYKSITQPYNYVAAFYCLTIEFYGYDSQGKLVAPATGNLSNSNTQAVIKKYYPINLVNITFRTTANQIVYNIEAAPLPYNTATSQARGTIPFSFALSGQTVSQLLQGGPIGSTTAANKAEPGARVSKAAPTSATIPPMPTEYNTPGWSDLAIDVRLRAQQSWFDTYGRQYNADGTAR